MKNKNGRTHPRSKVFFSTNRKGPITFCNTQHINVGRKQRSNFTFSGALISVSKSKYTDSFQCISHIYTDVEFFWKVTENIAWTKRSFLNMAHWSLVQPDKMNSCIPRWRILRNIILHRMCVRIYKCFYVSYVSIEI